MNFDLPDEHRMMRDTVREFCEEEISPLAQEIEDEHRFPPRCSTSWEHST